LVYAGDAFVVTPLTRDNETIISQISALTTDIMPVQGSNTVMALQKAVQLLQQAGQTQGDILLVTDEVDYQPTLEAIKSLTGFHLSILGVGTTEGSPNTQQGLLMDTQGNAIVPKLNSQELWQLAKLAKGRYQTITADDTDIENLLAQFITPLNHQQATQTQLQIGQWQDEGIWLLWLVIPLAAFTFRRGLLMLGLWVLLPFPKDSYAWEWQDLWQTQNQQAQQAFQQHHYQQAAEKFTDQPWQAAAQYRAKQFDQAISLLQNNHTATGQYNLGNALAQVGQLSQSIKAYEHALQLDPNNEDALFNLQQVKKQLEDQQKSQDKQGKQGEQSKQGKNNEESKNSPDRRSQQNSEKSSPQQSKTSEQNNNPLSKAQEHQGSDLKDSLQTAKEKQPTTSVSDYDETKQADEQWLNRIPDDPAGLLRRKFKYQYNQRHSDQSKPGKNW